MEFIDSAFWFMGASITILCGVILIFMLIAQVIIMGNRLQHRFVDHVGGIKFCREFQKWAREQDKKEE